MSNLKKLAKQLKGFFAVSIVLLFVVFITTSGSTDAADKNLVRVFADGISHSVSTDATTVGEVLDRLKIATTEQDLIEPRADTVVDESSFNINVYRSRNVAVYDGDNKVIVKSPSSDGFTIAKSAGLDVYKEDTFKLSRINDFLSEGIVGMRLDIVKSTPYEVDLFGEVLSLRTQATTVDEALKSNGIDPASADRISADLSDPLESGKVIKLVKVDTKTVTEEEEIGFTERIINDSSIEAGQREIDTAGVKGQRVSTYEVRTENDVEVGRTLISEVVAKQPSEQVVRVGTKGSTLAVSGGGSGTGSCNLVYNYSDWPANIAYGICMAESSGNPGASNFNDIHHNCAGSFSLMQVACFWYPHYGYSSSDYYDGAINVDIAHRIWQSQGGFGAWTTYTAGKHLRFL